MDDVLRVSYRFCARLARREARNFYYSFLLLPPGRRRSMCALYAFLRQSDDLADNPSPAEFKRVALAAWRQSLEQELAMPSASSGHSLSGAIESAPRWPGMPALVDTVRRHSIPVHYLFEVLDGVRMDMDPRLYATFDDLYGYCYHVASAVGLSCIHIWGYRSDGGRAERLAESCGVALQLTNILRDVREDAEAGRVYLPQEDLRRFGVVAADLAAPRMTAPVRSLLEFEGGRAYEFYGRSSSLIRLVTPMGRPVLRAIVGIYRALLDEIAARQYDVLSGRISLPPWRKAAITLRALIGP